MKLLHKENVNKESMEHIKGLLLKNKEFINLNNSKLCLDFIKKFLKIKKTQEYALKNEESNTWATFSFQSNIKSVSRKCVHISIASYIWSQNE